MRDQTPHKTEAELLEEEIKENKTTVVPFNVVTGGKSGGDNWLWKLPEGTVFLAREKFERSTKDFLLHQFHVMFKTRRSVLLLNNMNTPELRILVDPTAFSRTWELFEIQILGEEIDGDSDQPEP